MMSGIATLLMCTVGCRLPIFQGPSSSYIIPLLGLTNLAEWSCPNQEYLNYGGRLPVPREIIYNQLSKLQGSLMVAGTIHLLIGFTGLVGMVARYVGPITIVPALLLAVYYIHRITVKFAETHWGTTTLCGIILSLYLRNYKTPIPFWTKKRGFHIIWYPLHQVFSILLSVIFGWILSVILTYAGVLSSDPTSTEYYARTDARNEILSRNPWFFFPYPCKHKFAIKSALLRQSKFKIVHFLGQFSMPQFDTPAFAGAMVATIMSIVDSICDYNACARMCYVPFPPSHALNRGIFWEGLMSFFAGITGCGHGTNSYGGNIGAIGITKAASRLILQGCGVIYVLFAVLGKLNAAFITIPYSVLGGTMILYYGIFFGVILSQLQFVNLNDTRNLAILGISVLVGFMLPHWVEKRPDGLNTGIEGLDRTLTMLAANGVFVAGFVACFLDNTVSGSRESRGLEAQLGGEDTVGKPLEFLEGKEVYDIPWLPKRLKNSALARISPMLPNYTESYKSEEQIKKK
ncbi:hypothetical protein LOTGIDRAFT_217144 [Lottia gigantea]|uniref:SLC26A/SulP transporter domain-containing protein n=1 Tax=Lottia gigantea TaxID=225164 RepID=V4BSM3_LOTGI|nr:hypothetical protein LOTGIDRAFT_217144 [Lottia gigantea]ESO91989.1 hypothetical protein LOTGIDRAFT_217144 [Lottia gigantea]